MECAVDEGALLDAFFAWLARHDPDLILGWNVVNFDLDFLQAMYDAGTLFPADAFQ